MSRGRTFILNQLGSSSGAGGGGNGEVAFFSGPFTLSGDSSFTYSDSANRLSVDNLAVSQAAPVARVDVVAPSAGVIPLLRGALSSGVVALADTYAVEFRTATAGAFANGYRFHHNENNASRDIMSVGSSAGAVTFKSTAAIVPSADDLWVLGASNTGYKQLFVAYTDRSATVTGSTTINKMAGSVNFAAAMTTVVVTNSIVTTSSKVFASISTSGSTGVIGSIVPANGSFAINMTTAPGAETRVHWFVLSAN